MKKFFKKLSRDIGRIRWTKKKELWQNFLIVLFFILVFATLFFLIDLAILKLITL